MDFALLLGTDFSQRIKNLGPARALKFIRKHGSIENIVKKELKYPPRSSTKEYLEQVALAREAFASLPPITKELETLMTIQEEDVSADVKRVMQKFGLARELVGEKDFSGALAGNYFADNPSFI